MLTFANYIKTKSNNYTDLNYVLSIERDPHTLQSTVNNKMYNVVSLQYVDCYCNVLCTKQSVCYRQAVITNDSYQHLLNFKYQK